MSSDIEKHYNDLEVFISVRCIPVCR